MAIVRFDGFEVDLTSGQIRRRGSRIRLRDQPPIRTCPFLDCIRGDPRYMCLLRKMNLADAL